MSQQQLHLPMVWTSLKTKCKCLFITPTLCLNKHAVICFVSAASPFCSLKSVIGVLPE